MMEKSGLAPSRILPSIIVVRRCYCCLLFYSYINGVMYATLTTVIVLEHYVYLCYSTKVASQWGHCAGTLPGAAHGAPARRATRHDLLQAARPQCSTLITTLPLALRSATIWHQVHLPTHLMRGRDGARRHRQRGEAWFVRPDQDLRDVTRHFSVNKISMAVVKSRR